MTNWSCCRLLRSVALLAEGVDRTIRFGAGEIQLLVALLAEGVDRNTSALPSPQKAGGRPPRGGRG